MEYDLTLFEKGLEELGIALSQEQKKQFITYYEFNCNYRVQRGNFKAFS